LSEEDEQMSVSTLINFVIFAIFVFVLVLVVVVILY